MNPSLKETMLAMATAALSVTAAYVSDAGPAASELATEPGQFLASADLAEAGCGEGNCGEGDCSGSGGDDGGAG